MSKKANRDAICLIDDFDEAFRRLRALVVTYRVACAAHDPTDNPELDAGMSITIGLMRDELLSTIDANVRALYKLALSAGSAGVAP